MDLREKKLSSKEVATILQIIPQLDLRSRIRVLNLLSDTVVPCECDKEDLISVELKSELLQAMGLAWQIIFLELNEVKDDALLENAVSSFMAIYNTLPELISEFIKARKIMKDERI